MGHNVGRESGPTIGERGPNHRAKRCRSSLAPWETDADECLGTASVKACAPLLGTARDDQLGRLPRDPAESVEVDVIVNDGGPVVVDGGGNEQIPYRAPASVLLGKEADDSKSLHVVGSRLHEDDMVECRGEAVSLAGGASRIATLEIRLRSLGVRRHSPNDVGDRDPQAGQ